MHKWRYHPGVELLAELVRSEELGPVVGLRTTRIGWGNPHGDVDGIWMLASHDLSIALEVLGTIPEPRAAVAELVAQTATGLVGLLGDDPWFALEISTSSAVRRREVRLICRDGVATLGDAYADNVVLTTGRVDREPLRRVDEERPVSTELPLLRELRAFLEYLAGGPPPRSSAAEALADVEAIAGLRELAGLPRSSVVP
jgi:predicted dehydrogenase